MQNKILQRKRALRTALLVLLLGAVGMGKGYAQDYDFSAICPTGQTLYYAIIHDYDYPEVALVCPNAQNALSDGGWEGFTKPTGNITLPSTVIYNGITYTVRRISGFCFCRCDGLTGSLTIPNSVTEIFDNAFNGCSGFSGNLTIPNSVTSIGEQAFHGCSGFAGTLTLPNSLTEIRRSAFSGCSGFNGGLTIPNSVTEIGSSAFYGCSGFSGLTISNSVTSIGINAFICCHFEQIIVGENNPYYDSRNNCNAIIETNTNTLIFGCKNSIIPNTVTSIGESAFERCVELTSINIPNSVITIEKHAFLLCSGLTGSLTIPNSVTTIGVSAFRGCTGLTGSLTIGNSVTTIGGAAFYECSGFTGSLTIPNSVTTIRYNAFWGCSGFTGSLTIPNSVNTIGEFAFAECLGFTGNLTIGISVTSIGGGAFMGCSGFTSVSVLAEALPIVTFEMGAECVFDDVPKDIPVYVPCDLVDEYQSAMCWNEFTNYIGYPYYLTVEAVEPEHCTVSIVQHPSCEEPQAIVRAEPAEGYMFVAWEEDETVVSNDAVYTFTVENDTHLTAIVRPNTGVSESLNEIVDVYPNPTSGQMKVEAENIRHITISNMLGQIIYDGKASGNEFAYDFSGYEAGVYIIRIETTSGVATKRVVVTR